MRSLCLSCTILLLLLALSWPLPVYAEAESAAEATSSKPLTAEERKQAVASYSQFIPVQIDWSQVPEDKVPQLLELYIRLDNIHLYDRNELVRADSNWQFQLEAPIGVRHFAILSDGLGPAYEKVVSGDTQGLTITYSYHGDSAEETTADNAEAESTPAENEANPSETAPPAPAEVTEETVGITLAEENETVAPLPTQTVNNPALQTLGREANAAVIASKPGSVDEAVKQDPRVQALQAQKNRSYAVAAACCLLLALFIFIRLRLHA